MYRYIDIERESLERDRNRFELNVLVRERKKALGFEESVGGWGF